MEAWMFKYALAAFPVAMFVYALLSRDVEAEVNHLLASGLVFFLPEKLFELPKVDVSLALPAAVYGVSLLASSLAILAGPHPKVPLDGPLPVRLAHQMGRIINEEALFRGWFFLIPLISAWGSEERWLWFALPQALLFALVHALPVYFVLRGRGRAVRALIGGFAFPLAGALVLAYTGMLTGGLLVPVAVHFATNALAELFFQAAGWKTVFAVGAPVPAGAESGSAA